MATFTNLNLTLSAQVSKLNKIVCFEPIDTAILQKLINSDLLKKEFKNTTLVLLSPPMPVAPEQEVYIDPKSKTAHKPK